MGEIPKESTFLRLQRRVNSKLQVARKGLGYRSASEFIEDMVNLCWKKCWTRREIDDMLIRDGLWERGVRIPLRVFPPEPISGTAKDDPAMYENLGLDKPSAKQIYNSEREKKKLTSPQTESMPTSTEFFKKKTEK